MTVSATYVTTVLTSQIMLRPTSITTPWVTPAITASTLNLDQTNSDTDNFGDACDNCISDDITISSMMTTISSVTLATPVLATITPTRW